MGVDMNFRVTAKSEKGGRNYMEDEFSINFERDPKTNDILFAYFGIFDGHGGPEASNYVRQNLLKELKSRTGFWSKDDDDMLEAIKESFLATHSAMWKELPKWPKRSNNHPSTAGTTCSIGILRNRKLYIGHVGDSGIVLGQDTGPEIGCVSLTAKPLTRDHKPDCPVERKRIENMGGKVANKHGVNRVVWNRPKMPHNGPIRRSTQMDQIPFLAVARSLGDLWSHNPFTNQFAVSPDPDVSVIDLDPTQHRCLIFASDGLWNMISPEGAIRKIEEIEQEHSRAAFDMTMEDRYWYNPAHVLVNSALDRWSSRNMRADNTTCITVMIDPPGRPVHDVIKERRNLNKNNENGKDVELPEEKHCSTWKLIVRYAGQLNRLWDSNGGLPTPPPEKEDKKEKDESQHIKDEQSPNSTTAGSTNARKSLYCTRYQANVERKAATENRKRKLITKHLHLKSRYPGFRTPEQIRRRIRKERKYQTAKETKQVVKIGTARDINATPAVKFPVPEIDAVNVGPRDKVLVARPRVISRERVNLSLKHPHHPTTKITKGDRILIARPRHINGTPLKRQLRNTASTAGVNQRDKNPAATPRQAVSTPNLLHNITEVVTSPSPDSSKRLCENVNNGQVPASKKNVTVEHIAHRNCHICPKPVVRHIVSEKSEKEIWKYGYETDLEKFLEESRQFRADVLAKRKKQAENNNTSVVALKRQANGVEGLRFTALKRKHENNEGLVDVKLRKVDTKSRKETFNQRVACHS